jgi:hypothetical protein
MSPDYGQQWQTRRKCHIVVSYHISKWGVVEGSWLQPVVKVLVNMYLQQFAYVMALTRERNIIKQQKRTWWGILGTLSSRNDCHVKVTHGFTPLSISMVNRNTTPEVKLAAIRLHPSWNPWLWSKCCMWWLTRVLAVQLLWPEAALLSFL